RSLSHSPLFQVAYNFLTSTGTQVEAGGLATALNGLTVARIGNDEGDNRFDLALGVSDSPDRIAISFAYMTDLFDRSSVERLLADYTAILEDVTVSNRDVQAVGILCLSSPMIPPVPVHYPFKPVVGRIDAQAVERPDAVAVTCEGEEADYAGLVGWSSRIGRRLQGLGVLPDERVGLCVTRSIGMIVGLLGILRAGGAYVPLDAAYPRDRLALMIGDSGLKRVVVDARTETELGDLFADLEVIRIEDLADGDATPFAMPVHPDQLAYVIYTSGSTGTPKGVGISHRALNEHLGDFLETYGIHASDRMLSTSTINFDVAVHELLPALIMGGQVVVRGPDMWSLDHLTSVLREQKITFSRIPTAYWKEWLDALPEDLPALRQVTVGGEGLPGDALRAWHETALGRQVKLDNLYGPTETTIASHWHATSVSDGAYALAPIGQAYPSRSDVILNISGGMVPTGGLGELCIGGETLARGYLGRASLTAERFVPDPWGEGTRLYRTGDLCCRRADGVIEFHGRIDQQVKLRGYRIEPGEVEAALRAQAGVRDAVVVVSGHGPSASLVAYVTGDVPDTAALRQDVAETLPTWMVPSVIMVLETLPLLPNGKLDRRALPEPDASETGTPYVAPRNEAEATLLAAFRTVLGRDDIGVEDNFFSAGGDSIMALKIPQYQPFNIKFEIRDIFMYGNVRAIIEKNKQKGNIRIFKNVNSNVSVFFVHPAFGLCADFSKLANQLTNINSYFIESPYFYRDDLFFQNVDSAIDYYEKFIMEKISTSNILVSWSLGSIIGDLIFRRLRNKKIDNLIHIKIDPFSGNSSQKKYLNKSPVQFNYNDVLGDIETFINKNGIKNVGSGFIKNYLSKMYAFNNMLKYSLFETKKTSLSESVLVFSDEYRGILSDHISCYKISSSSHLSIVSDKRVSHIIRRCINQLEAMNDANPSHSRG
ncbi:non-ribosomal peptide synthetase, partial [Acetobacter orientalis]|uniref:non-ribosomal peptide synthetase n=1 Tax=Acetobacter orientalis TaxID=146474 RepID=UPI0039EA5370